MNYIFMSRCELLYKNAFCNLTLTVTSPFRPCSISNKTSSSSVAAAAFMESNKYEIRTKISYPVSNSFILSCLDLSRHINYCD